MMQSEKGRWHLAGATPSEVLLMLPDMGKIMVIFRENGVTHERIGVVETATAHDCCVDLKGGAHDARVDASVLSGMVLDTSSEMQGRTYPRLEFIGAGGETVFAVVGMEGAAPFITALSNVGRSDAEARSSVGSSRDPEQPGLETDRGHAFLKQLIGSAVEIVARRPGFRQAWQGRIDGVKPAMGFSNVMTGDFHLHLKGGTVADWQADGDTSFALDDTGARTGLEIRRVGAHP
ncbi:ChuX/HutX family heme-like substrate-binding protein [Pukyongiella litopenaei]|uniref:Haemin-degrading HemS/ChuX domain-containing protein n=1 Tax=Pukyongiella litopenaei TaxID=2605946 RepID=A0A2S0MQ30_9RHOB|nr:ChuX/HutX family heme-like substrate-binding protein [Pukyongiella litopenaei]AVO37947.1 hypothetical protein C6Y53_09685 [Pukyongiella litopenaei]